MQLTYNQARDTIIEHTEIGYTIASQDRLWFCFIFDLWSEGQWATMRYNRLYPTLNSNMTMYDMMGMGRGLGSEGCLVWTTRAEAEFYAEDWRQRLADYSKTPEWKDMEIPEVYVMNLGDDARYENQIIGHKPGNTRAKPKFKGSEAAWAAMPQMYMRATQWRAEREAAKAEDEEPSCP